jgi:TP901-1 family phage major tail protein
MAAQKGREVLLKIDISGTKTTVGGIRSNSINLNDSMVDITDQASTGRFRELLAAAGVKTVSISGSGVFKDSTAENAILTNWINGTIPAWDLVVPGLGTFTGPFQITQLQINGGHDGEVQFSCSLESGGEITFA